MGTYNQWFVGVNVNTTDTKLLDDIRKTGRRIENHSSTKNWDAFCFLKWSDRTKWDPCDLIRSISKEYDTLIFSVYYQGDDGSGKIFYFQGEEISEREVFPPNPLFPTVAVISKAIKKRKSLKLAEQIKEEKQRMAKEAADKQKRIKELEAELLNLKKQKDPVAPSDWSEQHG